MQRASELSGAGSAESASRCKSAPTSSGARAGLARARRSDLADALAGVALHRTATRRGSARLV